MSQKPGQSVLVFAFGVREAVRVGGGWEPTWRRRTGSSGQAGQTGPLWSTPSLHMLNCMRKNESVTSLADEDILFRSQNHSKYFMWFSANAEYVS